MRIDTTCPSISPRNYGIDLFRMVSMYMVCVLHVLGHGGMQDSPPRGSLIALFFHSAALCAVNCFALISGYVGVKAQFKYRNLFRLWKQAFFYSVIITVFFYFLKPDAVGTKELVKAFLPISSNAYWYLTQYALMFFLIPQMNFILEKQDKDLVKFLLWTFFILFSLCGLTSLTQELAKSTRWGFSAIWLAYLYVAGGFVRLYGVTELLPGFTRTRILNRLSLCMTGCFQSQGGRLFFYLVSADLIINIWK